MPARATGKARPAKPNAAGTDFELADRLHSAAIHLLRRLRREDAASGLAPARLSALSVLAFGGPMNLTTLAAAEQVKAPTMTKVVQALEEEGLVRRQANPADGRGTVLAATAKGRRIMEEGRRRRVQRLAADLAALPDAGRATLVRAVAILDGFSGREHAPRP